MHRHLRFWVVGTQVRPKFWSYMSYRTKPFETACCGSARAGKSSLERSDIKENTEMEVWEYIFFYSLSAHSPSCKRIRTPYHLAGRDDHDRDVRTGPELQGDCGPLHLASLSFPSLCNTWSLHAFGGILQVSFGGILPVSLAEKGKLDNSSFTW